MERWRDGEMERWRDGEMERWREGEGGMERLPGEALGQSGAGHFSPIGGYHEAPLPLPLRSVHLLRVSLLRFLESNFPGDSLNN